MTIPAALAERVARQGDERALTGPDGVVTLTWAQYADQAARLAGGLRRAGLRHGDRVVLLLPNCLEFHLLDMAVLLAGGTPVSIYATASRAQVEHVLRDTGAGFGVAHHGALLERLLEANRQLRWLDHVIAVGPADGGAVLGVTELDDLMDEPLDLAAAAAAVGPQDLATVIYTSGTTGPSKGVMLTHANVRAAFAATRPYLGASGRGRRILSYLPMAHIAERMSSHYNHVLWGSEVSICPDAAALHAHLPRVRPSILFGPPRVWEKLLAAVDARRAAGDDDAAARRAIGLDALELAIGGAAPLDPAVIAGLRALGIRFSEVYGMSENTGTLTWDDEGRKPGTVGRVVAGAELKLLADGEIACRGDLVFTGYLNDPARTAEALDADGWLHTGDLGRLDADGDLWIVGRKKELLVTSGGKNIAPAAIEHALAAEPLVEHAMLVGDRRPYITALLVLAPGVAEDDGVRDRLARHVATVNEGLSRVEQVKAFILVADDWRGDGDLMTATMKLRRERILARYAPAIDGLYAGTVGVAVPVPAR